MSGWQVHFVPTRDLTVRSKGGSQLRVAMVTSGFEPEIGGIESYCGELSKALVRAGCGIEVLAQCPNGRASEWAHPAANVDVPVLRFDDQTRTRNFRLSPGLWRYLHANGADYDIIHAHNFHATPALASATVGRRPMVFSPHFHAIGHTFGAKVLHFPYDYIARYVLKTSSAIVCDSAAESELLRGRYPQAGTRMQVIGTGVNGHDSTRVEPFREPLPVILISGRLVDYKRVSLAVEAFAHVSTRAELVITGVGPDEGSVLAQVRSSDLTDRVRLLGKIDRHSLSRWQRTAQAVVSLSTNEAFGMGVAEAAVAGAAIVVSDIPAHREIATLAGDTEGLVSVRAGAAEIGGVIERVLRRPRRTPSQLGFSTWDQVASRVQTVYSEVLGSSSN